MTRAAVAAFALLLHAGAAAGLDLTLPGAVETRRSVSPDAEVAMPEAPWAEGRAPARTEGAVIRRVLKVPGGVATPLQLARPLRETLEAEGYEIVFSCASRACGGFDFRFSLDLLGPPEMYVDLGDYHYVLARASGSASAGAPRAVALLVSRSATNGFVHLTEIYEPGEAPLPLTPATPPPAATSFSLPERGAGPAGDPEAPLGQTLEAKGHVILDGLDFASGSADLGPGPHPALEALARWLDETPGARIALVGHTDAVGSLAANTALSQRRAAAVRTRLIDTHGADPARVDALGAGYLAPRGSNLTEAGRAANRRVEAVLLSGSG